MEKFNMNYSDKNIPIPTKQNYKIQLISKTEKFIKRIRWKALQFLGKLESTDKLTYGFKTRHCPPVVDELTNFENDLMLMIKNIQFKNIKNDFQNKLKEDINEIKNSNKIFVSADKSRNIYKMEKEEYNKLIHENITKTYKKTNKNRINTINKTAKKIASDLELEDRIDKMQESECYITIKDHKEDFPNKLSCRLINPSKSDIGKISKQILDKINSNIRASTEINQWKNSKSVIDWFVNIRNKNRTTFFQFDIESFYPSISPQLFNEALNFARNTVDISDSDYEIITQSRKTLLFNNEEPWVKKHGDEEFDVPMGCFDGAEVCDLVGIYSLNLLKTIIRKENVGLYRDDGLGIIRNSSGPEIDRMRKQIIKVFKECGLNIVIKMNLKSVDFLDVRFNLTNNTYEPYRKPNNEPVYININSNHPPNILKELPRSINKRISEISCNERIFNEAKPLYEEALNNSGFNTNLVHENTDKINTENKVKQKREIIWFNPPFSLSVKTNIGKIFFKILKKHFPKSNQLSKIFNKNTIKISYSCTNNMKSIISAHNKQILRPSIKESGCNCRDKNDCPLDNKCKTTRLIYQADVTNNVDNEYKYYLGLTDTTFKERFNNHTMSFRNEFRKTNTELSKYVWLLKENGKVPNITWKIVKLVYGKTTSNFCKLCLTEKYYILNALGDDRCLNKRNEFIAKCRHQNKLLLKYVKDSND